ncbi:MAG: DegT/DnrJ/EryC1/StrS family aminotransferase [Pseudomonadota bacterium]
MPLLPIGTELRGAGLSYQVRLRVHSTETSTMTYIPHNRVFLTKKDKDRVVDVMNTGYIADCVETQRLETHITRLFGGGRAVATSSGTAALYLALSGLGLPAGTAVAVPSYACRALIDAVAMARLIPAIVDISADYTIALDSFSEAVRKEQVRAVIAVHTFGRLVDIQALREASDVPVIEDCCHALGGWPGPGVSLKGRRAIFSFYATKVVAGGQGGLLWDYDETLARYGRSFLATSATCSPYKAGFNFRFSDLQAALVLSQMERLDAIVERRRQIARQYRIALPPHLLERTFPYEAEMPYRFIYAAYDRAERDFIIQAFRLAGIRADPLYKPHELLHRQLHLDPGRFPHAERAASTTVSIPIFSSLTEKEVSYICEHIHKIFIG